MLAHTESRILLRLRGGDRESESEAPLEGRLISAFFGTYFELEN